MVRRRRLLVGIASAAVSVLPMAAAGASPAHQPSVLHVAQVARQDVAAQSGCEPDTLVEPDVAVSPRNRNVAVAVAHDCRYADGGAASISVAWTADGGATWHHRPVPGVTTATGGVWDRASDPVIAFAADGTAYLSILAFDTAPCPNSPSGVVVLRSSDGGRSWSRPLLAHRSSTCRVEDDKNWLVVDNSPASPHFGRVYQFWTPFLFKDRAGRHFIGAPQAVRWSDDRGRSWSRTVYVTSREHQTQNSQPMIRQDGTLVDTYFDFGHGAAPDAAPGHNRTGASVDATPSVVDSTGPIYAAVSRNGGRSWTRRTEITEYGGGYAQNVRCCLFAADIDSRTGIMYLAFLGAGVQRNTDPVFLAASRNGVDWSNPIQVSRGDVAGIQRVNVDVVARAGSVFVSYGTRTRPGDHGGFVWQQLSVSRNRGASFGAALSVGPRSVLRYAARSRGYFPGDYIGAAITAGRLYLVWASSSRPPASSSSPYHQVIMGATVRT